MIISSEEIIELKKLQTQGVLKNFDPKMLKQKTGIILFTCADCDQFLDLYSHLSHKRIHVLGLNGGALVIPDESPLSKDLPQNKVIRENIRVARELKKIDTIVLFIHVPCGAAHLIHLTVSESVNFLIQSVKLIKHDNPGAEVIPFIHVDWGNKRKRTYVVLSQKHDN